MTLSTPQHKPRSVSAYGRRRTSMGSSHTVSDFSQVKPVVDTGTNYKMTSFRNSSLGFNIGNFKLSWETLISSKYRFKWNEGVVL